MTLHDRVYIYHSVALYTVDRPCCPASPPHSAIWPRTHALMATTDTKKWRRKNCKRKCIQYVHTTQKKRTMSKDKGKLPRVFNNMRKHLNFRFYIIT
jgi:hypothetical protein